MKLKQCENGHYYDGDLYSTCPHCARAKEDSDMEKDPPTEKLDRAKNKKDLHKESKPDDSLWDSGYGEAEQEEKKDITRDIWSAKAKEEETSDIDGFNVTQRLRPRQSVENSGREKERVASSQAEGVQKPRSNSPHMAPDDEGKTVRHIGEKNYVKDPLVGWLVGLNGEVYGEGFPLVTGRNYIGRGADMDVVLRGDPSVSRNKHAVIIYEPKGKQFLIQPGESKELFYLNDQVVLDTQVMQNGCVLCIGETKLRFVAFCGEDFSWEMNA